MKQSTLDSISLRGAGVVHIAQPQRGHRFTLDSILLADFCRIKRNDRIFEPGAGTGIISLLLAKKFPTSRVVADEAEPYSYSLLRGNIERNGLMERVTPLNRDIQTIKPSAAFRSFDVIVANPPYIQAGSGKKSPALERHVARHGEMGSLAAWVELERLLKNKGKYYFVFSAQRAAELFGLAKAKKLEPKIVRFVHPRADRDGSLVLMEAVKGAGVGVKVLPPLIVHEDDGSYTKEMKAIYGI